MIMKVNEKAGCSADMVASAVHMAFKLKMEISDRIVEKLPESIRPEVSALRGAILEGLADGLSQYHKEQGKGKKDSGLKKVDIED